MFKNSCKQADFSCFLIAYVHRCSCGLVSALVSTDHDINGGGRRWSAWWCPASSDRAGLENVLGSPVLAFGEPLTYLAYDRPRHPIRLQPANELFLSCWELDALQVALHVPYRLALVSQRFALLLSLSPTVSHASFCKDLLGKRQCARGVAVQLHCKTLSASSWYWKPLLPDIQG
jgi:hypothetical protein